MCNLRSRFFAVLIAVFSIYAHANDSANVLFTEVKVFNGIDNRLYTQDVLVEGNMIKEIGGNLDVPSDVRVIDGGGRTLMPGLIDSHLHMSLYTPFSTSRQTYDPFMTTVVSVKRAEILLKRGFTTVRDLGGYSKYLTDAINKGTIIGPRVFGAGRMISQTSGHGDMRGWNDPHPNIEGNGVTNYWERYHTTIADGADEYLRAGRISLRNGAHFLKVFTSGGVSSEFDPLYMVQSTAEELQAAVTAAEQWKTYVAVHAYTDEAVNHALDNGVKVIEHAPLITEKVARRLAKDEVITVISTAVTLAPGQKEALKANFSAESYAKALVTLEGAETALKAIIDQKVKVAFGSDLVSTLDNTIAYEKAMQLREFEVLDLYNMPPIQAMRGYTSVGGELLAMTGQRNPWQEGPIGVIKAGAYADILLVDGNPLESLLVMTDENNFDLVMKDGIVYKNTL